MRTTKAALALGTLTAIAACGGKQLGAHTATPTCKAGPMLAQVNQLMAPFEEIRPVELHTPKALRRLIEPGCIAPFRAQSVQEAEELDTSISEVGKMSVALIPRDAITTRPPPVGMGRLYVGRGGLQIEAKNAAGEVKLYIEIKGKHAIVRLPGQPVFDADVDLAAQSPLPIPLDALVAAVDGCTSDLRVGIDDGGNTIEAKRGDVPLWRTRWLNLEQTAAIDTGLACTANDASFAWRTTAGDMAQVLLAVSARAPLAVRIERYEEPHKSDGPGVIGP